MSVFTATNRSQDTVPADRAAIWAVLTDPVRLTRLTPLLDHIEADGTTWTWQMRTISGLGVSITPRFTERMTFTPETSIAYTHVPPAGVKEWCGAEGVYHLREVDGGTHLLIELTVSVELPLPRLSAPAVEKIMDGVMSRTGNRFAANLLQELRNGS